MTLFQGLLLAGILVFFQIAHSDDGSVGDDALRPLITTSELVVGQNRFAFGLLKSGKLLEHADVELRLYSIDGQEARLAARLKPAYQPLEFIETGQSMHGHSDGTQHMHSAGDSGVRGIYITQLAFERPGPWGIEMLVRHEKEPLETARFTVMVLDTAATPAVGSPAPHSRNLIASDVKDLRQIDTSPRPDPRLHQLRIADAIAQRKPQLVVFATPDPNKPDLLPAEKPLDRLLADPGMGRGVNDVLIPDKVTIKEGGAVNFIIGGGHVVTVYDDGTKPEDIDTSVIEPATNCATTAGGVINDPTNRIYRGPCFSTSFGTTPSTTITRRDGVEVVQFTKPGRHLVICSRLNHFINSTTGEFQMFGFVKVLPERKKD